MKNNKNILVIGATGMVGHTVYQYLHQKFPRRVYGTARKKQSNFFPLNVESLSENFSYILPRIENVTYIINCIGALPNASKKELVFVNSEFPYKLNLLAKQYRFYVLHVSTDGVFDSTAGIVDEATQPFPIDAYGKSKLLGEQLSDQWISVRTSFIGFDHYHKKGLLEWALQANSPIEGFTNQLWSGCTTLQFGYLCENIIQDGQFKSLRSISPIFHFAPIVHVTKYKILNTFFKLIEKKNIIKKAKGTPVTRQLVTRYAHELKMNKYNSHLDQSLKKLIKFEKINKSKYA